MSDAHWLDDDPSRPDLASAVQVLHDHMRPQKLSSSHPFRRWWSTRSDTNRLFLLQLADDINTVSTVPGATQLLKLMRNDTDGFADFRYELRVAAALARAPTQRVVRLAGPAKGPDIEFQADSSHRCEIACYAARSDPPAVKVLRSVASRVSGAAFRSFAFSPLSQSFGLEVGFDSLPVRLTMERAAIDLAHQLLSNSTSPAEVRSGTVFARRIRVPSDLGGPGAIRFVRLRFLFAIRAFENARVARHLNDKIAKEADRWAAGTKNVALLAVESPDGCGDIGLHSALKSAMDDPLSDFAGVFLTHYPLNGVESVEWLPRQGRSLNLHVEYRTLNDNMKTWAGGRPVVSFPLDHAREDWDLVQSAAGSFSRLVAPLSIGSHHVRLPPVANPSRPTDDPNFRPNLDRAIERILEEHRSFPVAR